MRRTCARAVWMIAAIGVALTVGRGEAHASLIGRSADGTLSAIPTFSIVTQPFISPRVIGAGIEFQGQVQDIGFLDLFNVSADFTSNALFLTVTYLGPDDNGIEHNLFEVGFAISGSPQISGFTLNTSTSPPGGVSSTAFTESTLNVGFTDLFRFDRDVPQTWEFDIETGQPPPIPEPTSMILLGTGLIGLASRRRR